MRRAALAAALALCSVAPAGAHPGHGAESVTVDGDSFSYAPAEVTIGVGESVIWFWQGVVSHDHSVTADPGQAESFDSDPAGPPTSETHHNGDSFSHTFREEGRFSYHCQVHPGMTGVVNVVPIPGSSPLRLNGLRAADRGRRIHLRFFLSKPADLVVRVTHWRKPRWHGVKTYTPKGDQGRNELELSTGVLDPGRYRLELTAYDLQNHRASDQVAFSVDEK
jgi:plastocyanin